MAENFRNKKCDLEQEFGTNINGIVGLCYLFQMVAKF